MSDLDKAHRQKMQALKAEQKRKVQSAGDPEKGLVLVYTGDGKGKSSAAFGAIARALGWGHRVAVVQFIKGDWQTGEKQFFEGYEDRLVWHVSGQGFTWDTQNRAQDTQAATAALNQAGALMRLGKYHLVVLDEVNVALHYSYLDPQEVLATLEQRHPNTSVILTGRDAPLALTEYADLVTEMRSQKHPFEVGIKAQKGIDF